MNNGLHLYEWLFTRKPGTTRRSLDRGSLPTPLQYLSGRLVMHNDGPFQRAALPNPAGYYADRAGLRLIGRGRWRSALCPFHDDTRPSLRVNAETGAFRCMVCGAKGGDILAFHRMRHGLSFQQAARDLGAWSASQ